MNPAEPRDAGGSLEVTGQEAERPTRVASQPPVRRSHTKSRRGCEDCKRRKVKCDEQHPSCFNCTRRGVACSLDPGCRSPTVSANASSHASTSTIVHDEPISRRLSPSVDHSSVDVWPRGLELMHHYTNYTANTMALRGDMQHTWRVTIPEIAYSCSFLMHQLLSIAALHKSYLLPGQREALLDVAAHHQARGLEGFRAAFSGNNDRSWKELFCFSSMIAVSACTLPLGDSSTPTSHRSNSDVLGIFGFIRGIRAVLLPYQEGMKGTNLTSLLNGVWIIGPSDPCYRYPAMEHTPLPGDTFLALRRLGAFLQNNVPSDKRDDYRLAVEALETAAYLMAHAGTQPEVGMLIHVPYVLADSLMADIAAVHPCALLFLSHFSVLSRVLETRFWFMHGWSRRVLALVDAHLPDDSYFSEVIEWPRQQMFNFARLGS